MLLEFDSSNGLIRTLNPAASQTLDPENEHGSCHGLIWTVLRPFRLSEGLCADLEGNNVRCHEGLGFRV